MNMIFKRKLPIPQEVKRMLPVSPEGSMVKKRRDTCLREIFSGKSDTLVLIVGPCSADREDAILAYMHRLKAIARDVSDKVLIVPRLYTAKPRTLGDGYMGILHQPNPHGTPDPYLGILSARKMHIDVLNETGFTCADEMLYPENHRYFSDVLSYVSVGARSTENQQHRLTASGLNIPVGIKNPLSGDLEIMMDGIYSAQKPHHFIYRGWDVQSTGNPMAHGVLRGYHGSKGVSIGNYGYDAVMYLLDRFEARQLAFPGVVVDVSHDNAGRDYEAQIPVAKAVVTMRQKESCLKKFIKGLMIESYLLDGCQSPEMSEFGKSITDPCLGMEKTFSLIREIYEMI